MKKLFLFIFAILITGYSWGQNNGDYRSKQSGVWGTASNWEVYNSGAWTTAVTAPPSNCAIEIQANHSITNGNVSRTVSGNTIIVNGTLDIDQGSFTVGSTSSISVNGILKRTTTITITGSITVNNNGTFQFNANTTDPAIPSITWQTGSTCEILGGTNLTGTIGGLNQTFHHFKVNGISTWSGSLQCSGALTTINGDFIINNTGNSREFRLATTNSYTLNIGRDLIVTGGTLNFGSGNSGTRVINIGGSFNQSGGTIKNDNVSCTINYTGINKSFTKSSGTLTNTYINWSINTGASLSLANDLPVAGSRMLTVNGILDCASSIVSGAGAFTLNSGSTLKTKNTSGLTSSGAIGAIQVTGTRTFNVGASYIYNGTSSQVTGNGLPITVNNLTIDNSAGVSLSGNLTVNGTLELISGALTLNSNTLAYGTNGVLKYSGTYVQTATAVEWPASGLNNVEINGSDVILDFDRTLSGNFTINTGKKFTLNADKQLTVNGSFTNITAANFVLKNGASFINSSTNVAATMEREISAANWNSTDEGWHVLSSPVVGQGISGAFTPTGTNNDYDFYAWDEENYTWLNQKVGANNINTFGNAIGYLVAYQQAGTKTFAGNLNNADVNVTLSYANTTANKKGWNLLGNPYPCALDWSYAAWDKSQIDGAKIWNSTTKNWVDLPLATTANIIPANQGFLVKANSGGSFTIPAAARIHSGQGFYKSTSDMLILKAEKTGTAFNDVMGIDFNSSATLAYDTQKDAIEFETFGDAPSLYSVLSGGENVSINAVPAQLPASTVINLNFKARTNGQYSINATAIPSIPACTTLLLEDSKNNVTHNLKLNPVYNFTAAVTDNINRFKLHFQTFTGIEEAENNSTLVYAENAKIFISSNLKIKSVEVYNELGQQLSDYQVNGNNFNFSSKGKIQIIRIVTDNGIIVRKVLNL